MGFLHLTKFFLHFGVRSMDMQKYMVYKIYMVHQSCFHNSNFTREDTTDGR